MPASEPAASALIRSERVPFELAESPWPAVEQIARQLLVVPVGSLEQHGPHLPLDTDTRIAAAVARRETSVMLALAPGAVRLEAAERGDVRPLDQILPVLRERGARTVSPNGVLGDPAGASAAEGERLLARLVGELNAAMDRLLERPAARPDPLS
jgi:creatinine amidohydrolase/Fe(II)-dependent formamide hydrolase-like protein